MAYDGNAQRIRALEDDVQDLRRKLRDRDTGNNGSANSGGGDMMNVLLPLLLTFPALNRDQTAVKALSDKIASLPVAPDGATAASQLETLKPFFKEAADAAGARDQSTRTSFLIQMLTGMGGMGNGNGGSNQSMLLLLVVLAMSGQNGGGFSF